MIRHTVRLSQCFKINYKCNTRNKHLWSRSNIVKSPCEDVVCAEDCLADYVFRNLERWSNKTAMVCGVTNRQLTYVDLYRKSQVLAAKLRKSFKIQDGDTVSVMLPNMPEYPVIVLGISAAGGVVSTFNPLYTAHELERQLQISKPKAIFVVNETAPVVKEALKLAKIEIPIIAVNLSQELPDETVRYSELVDDDNIDLSVLRGGRKNPDDVSCLYYSSGTTGLPKGVELTHKNIVVNCQQQNTGMRQYDYTTESHQDTVLAILPIFHSYGLNIVTLHKLSVGLKLVTLPRFHPDTMLAALANHNLNILYLAPPTVLFLASNPQVTSKHFERVKCVQSGAAPLPQTDIEKFTNKMNDDAHFCQAYGLTETGPLACVSPLGYKNYKSVGFAIPNVQLRVVDTNLRNLGPNEVGELLIKGPNVMKGYKNNPEANKEVFVEDRWLRTGDLVTIDEDGAVFIHDRIKELIKVSGYQVAPAELEAVVKEHPGVFDAGVVGIKDPRTGERPKMFVVLNEGVKMNDEDIINFVNSKVAPYKKVKEVVFLDSIPKNPSGKILRRVLLEKYS